MFSSDKMSSPSAIMGFYFQVIWLCQTFTRRRSRCQSQGDYVFSINFIVQQWRQYLYLLPFDSCLQKALQSPSFHFELLCFVFEGSLRLLAFAHRRSERVLLLRQHATGIRRWHHSQNQRGHLRCDHQLNFYSTWLTLHNYLSSLLVQDWHDKFRNLWQADENRAR